MEPLALVTLNPTQLNSDFLSTRQASNKAQTIRICCRYWNTNLCVDIIIIKDNRM